MFHGREKFSRDLLQVLNRLIDDNNVKVRQSIAYGIHEVLILCIRVYVLSILHVSEYLVCMHVFVYV